MIMLDQYRDKWLSEKVDDVIGFYPREFYPLDNFSSFKVEWDGYLYSSLEEAYQAASFMGSDEELVEKVKCSHSADEAQRIAYANRNKQRKDWDIVKVDVMEKLLRLKLEQNPYVKKKLLQTKDYTIVEDSPKDSFWGWGPNRDGNNQLGKLWMKIRDELKTDNNIKRILLATTNEDKYKVVKKILESTIFNKQEYKIESLSSLNIILNDIEEKGNNIKRATTKAINAYNQLKDYNFEYIVGLDDAIRIRGKINPNIKKLLNKILYEHLLEEGEEFSFQRAYAFVDKKGKVFSTVAEIPYFYKSNDKVEIRSNSYPLAQISYPLGYDRPINMLNEEEELEYYLKYVKKSLENLPF